MDDDIECQPAVDEHVRGGVVCGSTWSCVWSDVQLRVIRRAVACDVDVIKCAFNMEVK